MREIKFRAWIKQWQKISKIHCIDWILGEIFIDSDLHCYSFKIDEVNLMQYTGLKDKKGKEIYEGDIIEISYKNSSIKQNAKVVYEKGCFFAELGDRFAYHLYEVEDNCEVIGNIHENSELLK